MRTIAYYQETLRRRLSTFSYSARPYREFSLGPTVNINALSGETTINGHSVATIISYWLNPLRIFDELARWSCSFDLSNPPTSLTELYSWLKFSRAPTIREALEAAICHVANLCRSSANVAFAVVRFIKTFGKKSAVAALFFLGVALLSFLANARSYKVFDPTPPPDPRHRTQHAANPTAASQVQEVYDIDNSIFDLDAEAFSPIILSTCKDCGNVLEQCLCAGYTPAMKEASYRRNLLIQRMKLANKRRKILQNQPNPQQCNVGDVFHMTLDSSVVTSVLSFFSVKVQTDWTVSSAFCVGDTRPLTEQHIDPGNCRYYVVSSSDISFAHARFGRFFTIPRSWLSVFGLPSRDLVVNEDHFRLQRKGVLSAEFNKSLKMHLETMLSVPICDPAFKRHGCNPLRDAFLVVRATFDEHIIPRYADF